MVMKEINSNHEFHAKVSKHVQTLRLKAYLTKEMNQNFA